MGSLRALLGVVAMLLGTPGLADDALGRIRAEGVLRVGIDVVDDGPGLRDRLARLATGTGSRAAIVTFERADDLVAALTGGQIDLAASPIDRARPIPPSLAFSDTVDYADLVLTAEGRPVRVRIGSDAWHRALGLRRRGRELPLRPLPGATPRDELLVGEPRGGATAPALLLLPHGTPVAGLRLARRQPRAWLLRSADRSLAAAVDQFLQAEALWRDARENGDGVPAPAERTDGPTGRLSPFDGLAQAYGQRHGIDWRLLLAVMYKESRFDPDAVSRSGARGLMQLKPEAAAQVGVREFQTPEGNVRAGTRYLAWLYRSFEPALDPVERVWLALAAYNGGPGTVARARQHAARFGRDPNRWFGHVERSVQDVTRGDPVIDGTAVRRYVAEVRRRLHLYLHLTAVEAERHPTLARVEGAVLAVSRGPATAPATAGQ